MSLEHRLRPSTHPPRTRPAEPSPAAPRAAAVSGRRRCSRRGAHPVVALAVAVLVAAAGLAVASAGPVSAQAGDPEPAGPPDLDYSHDPGAFTMGLWSDGTTIWVATGGTTVDAFSRETGARDPSKDITVSGRVTALWSDGQTMWATNRRDFNRISAYAMDTGERQAANDLDISGLSFASESAGFIWWGPLGLTSDGETMWVASNAGGSGNRLYALDMTTKARKAELDIVLGEINHPRGLWTDGETMWVAHSALYTGARAYDIATKARVPSLDIEADGGTWGLWTDGEHMWMSNFRFTTVKAYPMPAAARTKWSATMSVGRGSAGGATLWGYSRWTSKGSLSPDRVELGVESTTVQLIGLDSAGDRLYLGLSERLSDDVTLVVGGTEFALAQAPPTRSAGWTHVWSAPDLDWSVGDEIEVQFVLSASSAEQPTDAVPTDAVPTDAVPTTTLPTPTTTTLPTPTTTTLPTPTTTTLPTPTTTTTTLPTPTTTTLPTPTTTTLPPTTTLPTTLPTPKKTPTMALPAMLLTASFADVPASHDGADPFPLRVQFSEAISTSYVNVRDDVFTVTAGEVTRARRVDGRSDLWEITVDPSSGADIVITLSADAECGTPEAVCTSGGLQLSNNPTVTIDGTD